MIRLASCLLATSAGAQSFATSSETVQTQNQAPTAFFVLEAPARKLTFASMPPARKMFTDLAGTVSLFPALFPQSSHFIPVPVAPAFFAGRFPGAFNTYRIGGFYLGLSTGYSLYSATIRNGRLFVMAKDQDGDFVSLDAAHIAVYDANGKPQQVQAISGQSGNISVLLDRSASMAGFDAGMREALATLSTTLTGSDHCALYEFGQTVSRIRAPMKVTCGDLFNTYSLSRPRGGTPVFEAMHDAYSDLQGLDTLSAVIIISDGAPSDRPSPQLASLTKGIPTFVLWVGNHTADHIAAYSTAHAISSTGGSSEIADFLRAVTFSVAGHQTFAISP